jgi:hypothetical protein
VSLGVLGLVLLAAWAHAAWNLVAKGAQGGAAFVWLTTGASAVLYAPVLVGGINLEPAAIALMAGSGALHAAYFVLLQRGYATGDLSLVYPLARGTGPLLSSVAAIAFLASIPARWRSPAPRSSSGRSSRSPAGRTATRPPPSSSPCSPASRSRATRSGTSRRSTGAGSTR